MEGEFSVQSHLASFLRFIEINLGLTQFVTWVKPLIGYNAWRVFPRPRQRPVQWFLCVVCTVPRTIPTRPAASFFTILLIGKYHGEHLGLCDFLHGMQFSVLQRPQDTQGIVCLAGDEQGTAPSGARLQDYHSKADKISRVYFPAFVTFFCGSPQTCVPNLIRPQQGAWT